MDQEERSSAWSSAEFSIQYGVKPRRVPAAILTVSSPARNLTSCTDCRDREISKRRNLRFGDLAKSPQGALRGKRPRQHRRKINGVEWLMITSSRGPKSWTIGLSRSATRARLSFARSSTMNEEGVVGNIGGEEQVEGCADDYALSSRVCWILRSFIRRRMAAMHGGRERPVIFR